MKGDRNEKGFDEFDLFGCSICSVCFTEYSQNDTGWN